MKAEISSVKNATFAIRRAALIEVPRWFSLTMLLSFFVPLLLCCAAGGRRCPARPGTIRRVAAEQIGSFAGSEHMGLPSVTSSIAEGLWTEVAGKDMATCCVCLRLPADSSASPCGHLAACHACLQTVMGRRASRRLCPVCRCPVTAVLQLGPSAPCAGCGQVPAETVNSTCGHWHCCLSCMALDDGTAPSCCLVCNQSVVNTLRIFR